MTTYEPIYRAVLYAPRSVDPDELTVLTPVAGAPHALSFRVATRDWGHAVRIGPVTTRYLIRSPVGTWPTTALTYECWARLDAGIGLTTFRSALSYARPTTQFNEAVLALDNPGSTLRLTLQINGTNAPDTADYPTDAAWHHLLATWDSSGGVVKLYLDGALRQTLTGIQSAYSIVGGGAFVVGQEQDSLGGGFVANQAWPGEIDEIRVYSRVLSPAEVKEHFGSVFRDETGLVGSWGFDVAGNLGRDASAAANHLTPVGIDTGTTDTTLHYRPYLEQPENGRRGVIDVRGKRTDTGVMTFEVVDPELAGGDPLARFLPAFLGDLKGQLRAGSLMWRVWESLDGGLSWSAFYAGRLRTLRQQTPVRYAFGVRELADDLQALAFVGRPHASVTYAAFPALLPVTGTGVQYGLLPPAGPYGPLTGTVVGHDWYPGRRIIILNSQWLHNWYNLITTNLLEAANVGPDEELFAREFGTARARVKRLDTGATGIFLASISANAPWAVDSNGSRHRRVARIGIAALTPQGVATGTPLTNGAHAAGLSSVATDGWTISITDIVRAGDVVKWSGHGTYYTLIADANSNGSGQATLAFYPPLTTPVADNESLTVVGEPGAMPFPPDGTAVEVTIEAQGRVTEDAPLLIGDVHPVTLWKHLLEGKFGFLWSPDEALPAGRAFGDPRLPVPYHAAEFAALEADATFPPLRFPVTDRTPRGPWIEENILRAANLAYYFDGNGVVRPVDLRTPTDVSAVVTITDADLELAAEKEWEYDRASAITRADATYYTETLGINISSLEASSAFFPTIPGSPVTALEHLVQVLDLGRGDLGDEVFELPVRGYRAMAGESLGAQPRTAYLQQQLYKLALDTARPFGVGAPTIPLSCKRGGNGDALQGALRKISIRSVPDPATNKLGGTRLVRVVRRQEARGFAELRVMDLGSPTVAGTPTIGAPAQETGNNHGGVSVLVTLNGAGDPVELQYAITDTATGSAPAASSALWTPAILEIGGRRQVLVRTTGTYTFRGLPAGKRIWVRGRSFPDARVNFALPSAWVAASSPGRVDLAVLPAPYGLTVSRQTARSFRVSWELVKNWLLRSDELENAAWSNFTTTEIANATAAPDGTLTADKMEETAATNEHTMFNTTGVPITSGEAVAVCVFVKAAERTKVFVGAANGGDRFHAKFDLGTGLLISTFTAGAGAITNNSIRAIGNGWYRIACRGFINGGKTTAFIDMGLLDAAGTLSYLGVVNNGAYFWRAMLEKSVAAASEWSVKTASVAPVATDLPIEVLAMTPTGDPRVVVARIMGGSVLFDFPGATSIVIQPSTTYRVGLRHYTVAPDSVGPENTVDPVTTATAPTVPTEPFMRPWIQRPIIEGLL